MRVGQTDAEVVQMAGLNHQPHFAQLRHADLRQEVEQVKRLGAFSQ